MRLRPFNELAMYVAGLGYGMVIAAIVLQTAHRDALARYGQRRYAAGLHDGRRTGFQLGAAVREHRSRQASCEEEPV